MKICDTPYYITFNRFNCSCFKRGLVFISSDNECLYAFNTPKCVTFLVRQLLLSVPNIQLQGGNISEKFIHILQMLAMSKRYILF